MNYKEWSEIYKIFNVDELLRPIDEDSRKIFILAMSHKRVSIEQLNYVWREATMHGFTVKTMDDWYAILDCYCWENQ